MYRMGENVHKLSIWQVINGLIYVINKEPNSTEKYV